MHRYSSKCKPNKSLRTPAYTTDERTETSPLLNARTLPSASCNRKQPSAVNPIKTPRQIDSFDAKTVTG
jgi:hypothetical protein